MLSRFSRLPKFQKVAIVHNGKMFRGQIVGLSPDRRMYKIKFLRWSNATLFYYRHELTLI